ncbi:MAG TPA: peptide-methionine (S)-S-oxide reductase MsrA [Casimicrobiaceae bacterium]
MTEPTPAGKRQAASDAAADVDSMELSPWSNGRSQRQCGSRRATRMTHSNSLHARAILTIGLVVLVPACAAVSLPAPIDDIPAFMARGPQTAVFAGGDFSGVEAVYRHVKGVSSAVPGYAGGTASTADDTLVSRGRTGHAESVQITYDPMQVSYGKLLQIFFAVAHDPTQRNRQGPDVGVQYRSVIFTTSADQNRVAKGYIAQLDQAKVFPGQIVTQVLPLPAFYPAESKYENHAALNRAQPYVARYVQPKIAHLRTEFPELYTDN